ncbi:EsaB/YukD family protein [Streptococcus sp. DD12]|uniref:EsaB/YukD family protein n=1 Tax=Streptococcus sp. DD12 TaxID=1777880 RepID=UPI0007966E39|nr:EsaB/YukD family protein [Streptococcus sp. DD12]KXT75908.1 hypothetical protein STRDD12_01020 [Streptococcus sp. DD12]
MTDHILVTLEMQKEDYDLSLPKHLALSKLLDKLAQLYDWQASDRLELKSKQTGQILDKAKSLAQSGIADGDCLFVLIKTP